MTELGPIFPASGQRYTGSLQSDLESLHDWTWPYITITGEQDGPQVTITGGMHGCEYVAIHSAMRLAQELKPAELRGRLLIVPIVGLPAFWERTPFISPIDGVNPNRVFPGKADGSFSEVMAYFIFNSCIAPSNGFIDLHGGDLVEELYPFTLYPATASQAVLDRSRQIAEEFGLPYMVAMRGAPGGGGGLAFAAAADRGIPSIIAEAGSCGQLVPDDVEMMVQGMRRSLQAFGCLDGEPKASGTTLLTRFDPIVAAEAGFWMSDVRAGDQVTVGQRLGRMFSLTGELMHTIEAPNNGVILSRTTSPAVKQGGALITLSS